MVARNTSLESLPDWTSRSLKVCGIAGQEVCYVAGGRGDSVHGLTSTARSKQAVGPRVCELRKRKALLVCSKAPGKSAQFTRFELTWTLKVVKSAGARLPVSASTEHSTKSQLGEMRWMASRCGTRICTRAQRLVVLPLESLATR